LKTDPGGGIDDAVRVSPWRRNAASPGSVSAVDCCIPACGAGAPSVEPRPRAIRQAASPSMPLGRDRRPPSRAAVSFFRTTAGGSKGRSVVFPPCGRRRGLCVVREVDGRLRADGPVDWGHSSVRIGRSGSIYHRRNL